MPDKFKKDIEAHLRGLKLSPTDSVWSAVEQDLDRKKRRRGIIWWTAVPLGLFLLFGILYFNLENRFDSETFRQKSDVVVHPAQPDHGMATAPHSPQEGRREESSELSEENSVALKPENPAPEGNALNSVLQSSAKSDVRPHRLPLQTKVENSGNGLSTTTTGVVSHLHVGKNLPVLNDYYALSEKELLRNPNPKISDAVSSEATPSAKWKLGLSFSPGVSFLTKKNTRISNDPGYMYSPAVGMPPAQSDISSSLRARVGESNYGSGYSYGIGLSAQRMLGNGWGVTSGIGFRRISLRHSTTLITPLVSTAPANKWIEKFDFIEIPVLLGYQSDFGKIKVNWEGGMVYSRLLSADTWQYDTALRAFDNHVEMNKNQISFQGRITFELLSNRKIGFDIGPYYQYSPGKVGKEGNLERRHFNSGGIQMRISLKK